MSDKKKDTAAKKADAKKGPKKPVDTAPKGVRRAVVTLTPTAGFLAQTF